MTEDELKWLTKFIRRNYETSFLQAKKAAIIAVDRFEGNAYLGYLWTEADSFSVNIKAGRYSEDPKLNREARDTWNDNWARSTAKERNNGSSCQKRHD